MPSEEKILETIPVGPLGIVAMENCRDLGRQVDSYIAGWRSSRTGSYTHTIAYAGYQKESYLVDAKVPRFGSGEAKGIINQSVRGQDLYILVDVGNYSMKYSLCGYENRMSPDDHYQDLKRVIAAVGGKARRITVIMPFLYESRQHKEREESLLIVPWHCRSLQTWE